ncbi:unnamed protein product, partial [Musa acuminata subsp. burmannicoides]
SKTRRIDEHLIPRIIGRVCRAQKVMLHLGLTNYVNRHRQSSRQSTGKHASGPQYLAETATRRLRVAAERAPIDP